MSFYKFNRNDVFTNTLKLYPEVKFVIYSGSAYYNNTPNISGSFTGSIRLTDAGNISLYELNVDRANSRTGRTIGPDGIIDRGIIYPWIVKDGSRLNFRTSTAAAFASKLPGDVITGSLYPYTASISKEFYSATDARFESAVVSQSATGPIITSNGSITNLRALKNTINYYRNISPHFEYSSSADSIVAGIHNRSLDSSSVGLISIPSVFYGSQIKKGSVNLEFFHSGTLIARAQDTKRNGELIQTYGTGSLTGSVVGLILYNEGFVILTSSTDLSANQDYYTSSVGLSTANWTYFGQSISGSITAPSSSFGMLMSGTTSTQVLTMFANAPKGELNHSNSPSFLANGAETLISTGSQGYIESDTIVVKNIVSSSYPDPTGSFEKTTYISKIGIYDEDRNLIGIAKVATPVKKTVERDFTFKIKLDI
mgnify:FL=1|tara:strand:- start:250 stop:1527 length:1278 start_codon:yes stop_codon:yes gene_type:complete